MDTSNNLKDFSFSIVQLRVGGLPGDGELADKAIQIIEGIVQQLKPILRYITFPIPPTINGNPDQFALCANIVPGHYLIENTKRRRAIEIGKDSNKNISSRSTLYLGENGEFFKAEECSYAPSNQRHSHNIEDINNCWITYPVGLIINKLQAALHEAMEKRENHLSSVAERSAKLDQIIAILKR